MQVDCSNIKRKHVRKKPIYFIEFLLYFPIFCPYIGIIDIGTDLQPYALLFSGLFTCYIFLKKRLHYKKEVKFLFLVFLFVVAQSLFSLLSFESIRSVANYGNIVFVPLAVSNLLYRKGLNEKLIKVFILVWFFVGLIQTFGDKYFLSFLLGEARTTESRGVFGLANEPSFYGITMVLMLFIAKDFKKDKIIFEILLVIQIAIFSQSTFAMIVLCIFVLMVVIGECPSNIMRLNILFSFLCIFILFLLILLLFFEDNRLTILIKQIFSGTIFQDESVLMRFREITNSLSSFVNNYFLPQGPSHRIMSGFGAVLVELGIFGFVVIYEVTKNVVNVFNKKSGSILLGILFIIMMLGAIQLSHPLIGFIIGYSWYKKDNLEYRKINDKFYCSNLREK